MSTGVTAPPVVVGVGEAVRVRGAAVAVYVGSNAASRLSGMGILAIETGGHWEYLSKEQIVQFNQLYASRNKQSVYSRGQLSGCYLSGACTSGHPGF